MVEGYCGVVGGSWAMAWAWFRVGVDQWSMNGSEGHFDRTLGVFRSPWHVSEMTFYEEFIIPGNQALNV